MIPLIKSTFYKEEETKEKLIKFIRKAKKLSFGEECEKFEKNFSKWQKRKYSIFVNSGSSANLALIQALLNCRRIKHGDLVGFSSVTWSTNVMPLIQLGLSAVPVDIELDTLNVSSDKLVSALKKYRLKALFLTNLLGFCDDIDRIRDICKKEKIILIEDNCESLGTVFKGKKLGNYGLASTFSFYVGHHMSTIEGGAICTDDEEIATMLKLVRAHGWDRNLDFAKQDEMRKKFHINTNFYSRYTFYDLGYNLRPTEMNGLIGNYQLEFIDEIIKKRSSNFLKMAKPIYAETDTYYPMRYDHIDVLSNFSIPVICRTKTERGRLVRKCRGKIEIRPVVGGDMTKQPFFYKYMKSFPLSQYSNAKIVHEQGLYFGNNPDLTEKEMQIIIDTFSNVHK